MDFIFCSFSPVSYVTMFDMCNKKLILIFNNLFYFTIIKGRENRKEHYGGTIKTNPKWL